MWAYEIAQKIIEQRPNQEVYTIATGVSPSGFIHIGNFREVVTPYFVAQALKRLGKKVRFIFSFDDFDRFRKVPADIPEDYAKYIGMNYSDMPSPFTKNESYAHYFEEVFKSELEKMGIDVKNEVDFIYQANEYRSGRYKNKIKYALEKRKEIFDIIDSFRTQDAELGERDKFFPANIYCSKCRKEAKIVSYNEKTGDIVYRCECGNEETVNIETCRDIKLQWKVDWPMRWQEENVTFESGGMDHFTKNGSHDVAEVISRKIFGFEPPVAEPYNFIGIKGGGAKMSSSKGGVLTITKMLNVYDPHLLLWFYAKYKPMQNFALAFDNDVIRYYSEFDRFVKAMVDGKLDDGNKEILSFTGVPKDYVNYPSFSLLATFLPIVAYNKTVLANLMKKEGIDSSTKYYAERLARAEYWVENYGKEYQVNLLSEKNTEFYATLSSEEKLWVKKTLDIIDQDYPTSEEVQTAVYAVVKYLTEDPQELKKYQKRFFEILYNLLLGQSQGPKLGIFLLAVGAEKLKSLLVF
ncbi:MAG: lysine--tRNA ligase [Clostridia bacterium]|nr:lysine--tRNA ligase [Clostridia bacterium]